MHDKKAIARRVGIPVAKAARRSLTAPLQSAAIIVYHRVARLGSDPQLLAVNPENFAEHLNVLRERYRPVRLAELPDDLPLFGRGKPPVALTFDDGYADNLYQARPLLESAGVPATVFVVAGQLDSPREFWWDELGNIFLETPQIPPSLALTIRGRQFRWEFPGEASALDPGWHVLSAAHPRQRAYRDLCELLRPLGHAERAEVLDFLRLWSGQDGPPRPEYRALSSSELVALAEGGLVEVGSHTVSHPVLSSRPREEQQREIEASKVLLEDTLGKPVTSFCYPHGRRDDYTRTTVRLIRQAGYARACSGLHRLVFRPTDRYELPRLTIRDWTGDEFERVVGDFFHG